MQSSLQFLRAVLPVAKFYAGVMGDNSNNPPKNKAFTSIEDLAAFLDQQNYLGWDTWFGCSGYEEAWHDDPTGKIDDRTGKVKKVFRTQQNSSCQKAFWMDIDVDPKDATKYATLKEAGDSLIKFVQDLKLPAPMIVCSGGGLHVYFLLEQQIDSDTWNSVAGMLDACVKHYGLRVDSTRTMDSASILRNAPAINRKSKYGPNGAPISVRYAGMRSDWITFKALLSQYMTRYNLSPSARTSSSYLQHSTKLPPEIQAMIAKNPELRGMMTGYYEEEKDKDAERIIKLCPQVANAGSGTEPVWMGMMTVMKCCSDGREQGRVLSMQDSRHTDVAYYEKFDRVDSLSGGPAKCSYFQRNNPDGCKNCPFNGRITSPAELGRIPASERANAFGDDYEQDETGNEPIVTSVKVEPIVGESALEATLAATPQELTLYKINSNIFEMVEYDGLYVERETKVAGELVARRVRIIDQSFFLTSAQKYDDFFHPEVHFVFVVMERGKPNRQIRLTAKDLKTSSSFLEWCANRQIIVASHNEKDFLSFMKAYLAQLQRKIPQVTMREQFGWLTSRSPEGVTQHGFILGDSMLSGNSVPQEVGLRPGPQRYAEETLGSLGTLAGWLPVPQFYHDNNIMWGQLGICLAFGAALMKFAPGTAKNGIVNFWSSLGGTGKSTLQEVINSVWGHPTEQMIQVFSTGNSRYRMMGWRNNLPICIDETTNVTDFDLSNLLFEVSEGREKSRMNQDSTLQSSGSWNTITVMSANNTVMDKMVTSFVQRDAEIKRVLDVEVSASPSVTREMATVMTRAYQYNYGHAGRAFVQHLLNDKAGILDKMERYIDSWVNKHSKGQDERFWENSMAVTVIAGRLAKAMGLIPFNMDALEEYAASLITTMRSGLINNKRGGSELFSDFISEYIGNALVVASEQRTTPEQADIRPELDPYVVQRPRGKLDIRMEADTGTIYVRAGAFSEWCGKRSISHTAILAELAAKKVLELPNQRPGSSAVEYRVQKRLGQGVSSIPANHARCYKLNLGKQVVDVLTGNKGDTPV